MINNLDDKREVIKLLDDGGTIEDLICSYDFCRAINAEHVINGVHVDKLVIFCFHRNKEKSEVYFHVDVFERASSNGRCFYVCGYHDSYLSTSHNYSWYSLLAYYKDLFGGSVNFDDECYENDPEAVAAFGQL